jgi:hypothetical protein
MRFDDTIVLNSTCSVRNCVIADDGPRVHHNTSENHGPDSNDDIFCDGCTRVYNRYECFSLLKPDPVIAVGELDYRLYQPPLRRAGFYQAGQLGRAQVHPGHPSQQARHHHPETRPAPAFPLRPHLNESHLQYLKHDRLPRELLPLLSKSHFQWHENSGDFACPSYPYHQRPS